MSDKTDLWFVGKKGGAVTLILSDEGAVEHTKFKDGVTHELLIRTKGKVKVETYELQPSKTPETLEEAIERGIRDATEQK